MLATATFFFGAALAGSDVQDRIGALKMAKVEPKISNLGLLQNFVETRRRADTWTFTTMDSELFEGTSACELGDFDGLPSRESLDLYEESRGFIYGAYNFVRWINGTSEDDGMAKECRPCLQKCLDGLAGYKHADWGYNWKDPSTKPDRAMVSCSLRCAERTADAVCDPADYLKVPQHMDGWTTAENEELPSNPFEDASFSPPCEDCLNKCVPILTSLDFDHLQKYEDTTIEELEDLTGDDKAVVASAFLALDQALREYHSCIACCSGFEMDTYYGAFPEGETCATAEEKFGSTDHHKSTKIDTETKYDVFGVIMTETQFYITLAVVGVLLLCAIVCCCYCCCVFCLCCGVSSATKK